MEKEIVCFLMEKGFKPKFKGFIYLVTALTHVAATDIEHIPAMTVYAFVAERHGIPVQCVERCIRTAIADYWKSKKLPMYDKPTAYDVICEFAVTFKYGLPR